MGAGTIAFRSIYYLVAALVLVGGIPIFVLGAGFGGGFGAALSSFRVGLASFDLFNWLLMLPLILFPGYLWTGRIEGRRPRSGLSAKLLVGAACLFDVILLFGSVEDTAVAELPSACHRGAYRLYDGRVMAVTVSPVAAIDVHLSDGTRAMTWTGDHLAFVGTSCLGTRQSVDDFRFVAPTCPSSVATLDTHDAPPQTATRIRLEEREGDFRSGGTVFRGRLFVPAGEAPVPLLILPASRRGVSGLDWGHEQYLIGGLGTAVFIYDQPETWPFGAAEIRSDGQAVTLASAALRRARELMGARASRVGFYGGRDALLAASRTDADFAIAEITSVDQLSLANSRRPVLLLAPGGDRRVPTQRIVEAVQRLQQQGSNLYLIIFHEANEYMRRSERRAGELCEAGEPRSYYPAIATWAASGDVSDTPDSTAYPPLRVVPNPR